MKKEQTTNPYANFDYTTDAPKKAKKNPVGTVKKGDDLRTGGKK